MRKNQFRKKLRSTFGKTLRFYRLFSEQKSLKDFYVNWQGNFHFSSDSKKTLAASRCESRNTREVWTNASFVKNFTKKGPISKIQKGRCIKNFPVSHTSILSIEVILQFTLKSPLICLGVPNFSVLSMVSMSVHIQKRIGFGWE